MLNYTIFFVLIAIIAGALGFGVVSGAASVIAKLGFLLLLILCIASVLRIKTT